MRTVFAEQVLQWVFAAAPGHPALQEICDHIAANALTRFSNNTNRDTLERTGPGVWTDVVLKHATLHSAATVCCLYAVHTWLSYRRLGLHLWVCSLCAMMSLLRYDFAEFAC